MLAGTLIERYVVLGMQEGQASYSPIVVYIYNYILVTEKKNSTAGGGFPGNRTPPPATVPKLSAAYCMRIIMYAHV